LKKHSLNVKKRIHRDIVIDMNPIDKVPSRVVNGFIFFKNDRFVKITTTKNRKLNDRF